MYNDKTLKSVAEAVKKVMEAELSAKQKQIAKIAEPKHKIDGGDLAALRAGKKPVKESGELGPKKDTKGKVVMVHKVNGKEMHVVNDPQTIERHKKMGYKVFKTVKEEASQEEFTAEIKKAQAKSEGKEKAEVAKPAVVAVKQESVEKVDEAMVKGKGYDKPENERKAPEGKLSMTSLMPGYSDKAARFAAVQAKGKLVKGSAQSAKQMEKGMKKEEVEQIDERTLTEPETAEKERLVKSMKKGIEGFKQRYGDRAKSVMYATATARAKENK